MSPTRDDTQRLLQQMLAAHPDIAIKLREDTLTRHAAQLEIVGYVLRHWPDRHKLNFWDDDQLRKSVRQDVQDLTVGMVT